MPLKILIRLWLYHRGSSLRDTAQNAAAIRPRFSHTQHVQNSWKYPAQNSVRNASPDWSVTTTYHLPGPKCVLNYHYIIRRRGKSPKCKGRRTVYRIAYTGAFWNAKSGKSRTHSAVVVIIYHARYFCTTWTRECHFSYVQEVQINKSNAGHWVDRVSYVYDSMPFRRVSRLISIVQCCAHIGTPQNVRILLHTFIGLAPFCFRVRFFFLWSSTYKHTAGVDLYARRV